MISKKNYAQRGPDAEPLRATNKKTGFFRRKNIRLFCSDEWLVSDLIKIILIFNKKSKYYFSSNKFYNFITANPRGIRLLYDGQPNLFFCLKIIIFSNNFISSS
jgi:hypothetical protein